MGGRGAGGIVFVIGVVMVRKPRGFTMIELLVVVAVIAVLALISFTVYSNVQARSRLAKAQADTRTMAGAIGAFQAHMGQMPAVLGDLTVAQTNVTGQVSGPFMAADAVPPVGWTYNYSPGGTTGYTITASGDNTSLTMP
jgi:prepilin-type N-terminal cleavage/methylation domain-containing protein